jgi:flagellar hook-associated protein 3 FlgL
MDYSTQKVATQRKFLSATEDPGSTARAYQLRKNFQQNNDWITNVQDILDTLDTVDASIMVLSDIAAQAHSELLIRAKNDTWSLEDRMIFANELRSLQKTAADALNSKFDDKFLFGGSSTKELPFEFDPATNTLKYRGIDVTSADPAHQAILKELANEKIYVDIGFGLTVDPTGANGLPKVADNSAFNISMPGINFLQITGSDPTDPTNNFILNLGIIADLIEKETFDQELTGELAKKLQAQHKELLLSVAKKGADYNFLEKRLTVLERNNDDLNNKILSTEFIDMEVAIMDMKMADYVYRAMLEMGSRILPPSFIDFMR